MGFRKISIIAIAILIACTSLRAQIQSADVCIYGATAAGVMAAYTASKMGKSVILIEPSTHLGGMTSGGLGQTDIGNKYAITGLARDFYRRIGQRYDKFEKWTFEPHVAKELLQQYLDKEKIKVVYSYQITSASKLNGVINSIELESNRGPMNKKQIAAKMFIDCSYEGDLMAAAGVAYTVGREANSEFNETINGVQLMQGHQLPDGIDPYKIPGKPESGLLWGISNEQLLPNGTGDKKEQAYNYRICLTSDPANRVTITRPSGYDSTKYELLLRLFEKQPNKRKLNDYFIWSMMPNNKTDINNRGGFSTDMIGMNYQYPSAGYDQRERIVKEHESYTKGLLYFYGHDLRVPKELRDEMLKWGYPKDEYVENGNWSPQLYVREARRMRGSYVMTQANCEGKEIITDGVGMAAYTMDSHNCSRLVINGMVKNEGNVEVGGFGPYPISYRSIIPKKTDCKNLFVPVCLSATHIAYGSIRMEPVFMVLAQSSAVAAVMAIDNKVDVQSIDVTKLQQQLKSNPLVDGSGPELLVDNEDKNDITVKGNWSPVTKGGYGSSLLSVKGDDKEIQSVRFTTSVSKKGKYDVYTYYPKLPDMSAQTVLSVFDGKENKEVTIRQADVIVEGQTSGEWVHLGSYDLPAGKKSYVEITTKNSNGLVFADAVIWVPVKSK
jgi:FAD dependent oxidoreductase